MNQYAWNLSALLILAENFTATMEEVCQDNNSPPGTDSRQLLPHCMYGLRVARRIVTYTICCLAGCRTFSDISSRKAGNAADILGLYILDGPAVVELSKPGKCVIHSSRPASTTLHALA